jgi:hypothetical protein
VITHLAFYAGWPSTFSALPLARDVFEKRIGRKDIALLTEGGCLVLNTYKHRPPNGGPAPFALKLQSACAAGLKACRTIAAIALGPLLGGLCL